MVESAVTSTLSRLKQLEWQQFFHMFHIEPIVFVLVFAHSLSGTVMRNEIIYQACTSVFQYNDTDCLQLNSKHVSGYLQEIETEVQPYVANLFMVRTLLESIVPAFCGVFVGSWSDHYGRKPLLLISMIGFSCTYIIAAIIRHISLYYIVNPWYYILAVVPHSILGGNCVFTVAAFCFISDVTDIKIRPYRMISLEAFLSIGLMMGALLSSYIYEATNATFIFFVSGILMCLTTVYIALYVPESLNREALTKDAKSEKANEIKVKCNEIPMNCSIITDNLGKSETKLEDSIKHRKIEDNFHDVDLNEVDNNNKNLENGNVDAIKNKANEEKKQQQQQEDAEKAQTSGLFSYIHVKEMWTTCFMERPFYDRSIILLVTGAMFLSVFVLDGTMTVFYLFVREKFQWTVRDFTHYETISHVTSMFGALVGFLILRKIFRMSVVTLTLLAFLSDIFRCIIQGMAYAPWHLYLAVAAGSLRAVGGPMCRTIVSNIVPSTDLGKIFSIKNILTSLAPFAAAPLYTVIYKASLTSFPGLFNIVSALFHFIAFIFILCVFRFKVTYKEHYGKMLK